MIGFMPALRLSSFWLTLLGLTCIAGTVGIHADNGFVAKHVDVRIEKAFQHVSAPALRVAADTTTLGSVDVVFAAAFVVLAALWLVNRLQVTAMAVTMLGAAALTGLAKVIIGRPGPGHRASAGLGDYAFPSGHSSLSAALLFGAALLLSRGRPRLVRVAAGISATMAALAVAVSRVVLDVHWFSDVVAGFALGMTWAWLVARTWGSPRALTASEVYDAVDS